MSREVRRVAPCSTTTPARSPRWEDEGAELARWEDEGAELARWEDEGAELARREGFEWTFHFEYHLTGFQGRDDTEPTVHPFNVSDDEQVTVRDADHLHELLTAKHADERPDPADYMPDFPEGTATGWCMYETTSEGTPISPVFETPEVLARWLADTGASSFGSSTATYEQWLRSIQAGWAPSAVAAGGVLMSGVEFVAERGTP